MIILAWSLFIFILLILYLLFFYNTRYPLPITGFAALDNPGKNEGGEIFNNSDPTQESLDNVSEMKDSSFNNSLKNSSLLVTAPILNGEKIPIKKGGSSSPPPAGYLVFGLNESLSLWLGGYFVNPEDRFLGTFRFSLYVGQNKISEFDLTIDKDIHLLEVIGNSSFEDGKAFIHSSSGFFKNISLFVPRKTGQNKVRICENASSFEQIYNGCLNEKTVTGEYVLDLSDPRVKLSSDESFFIISGISGTGGQSEGEELLGKGLEVYSISPVKNAGGFTNITFYYNVSGFGEAEYCNLVIDDEIFLSDYQVLKSSINNFSVFGLKKSKHFWEISCKSYNGSTFNSEKRKITIFDNNGNFDFPENLERINLEKIENFSIKNKTFGSILFLESINLSELENFSNYIIIKKNFISLDSNKLSGLNKPAILTFYQLNFTNPIILRDGRPCTECRIISYDGNLVFRVEHFSNYSAGENSALRIWDDTDNHFISFGNVTFYANYTNRTDDSPITSANCNIDLGFGEEAMIYNASLGLYKYIKFFSALGVYQYNVSCSASGFTALSLLDYASLTGSKGPSGANWTHISTSTAPADEATARESYAGNVTELTITGYVTTQTWQGYFGNVSGIIQLADSSDNVLYNWSSANPTGEIYATRAFDVNFPTISCASTSDIAFEESFANRSSIDSDSVSNTFNKKDHPDFYAGGIEISANSCNSTNLYDSTAGSLHFYEILLADAAANIVYTALLERDLAGFDSRIHDFQMIVAENGHNGDFLPTNYYFYLEVS